MGNKEVNHMVEVIWRVKWKRENLIREEINTNKGQRVK